MYKSLHRYCVSREVGEADGEDMVFIPGKRRRRKHFECLKMDEMDALGTGAKERFEEWLARSTRRAAVGEDPRGGPSFELG
jgi:hypothetical protein